MTCSVAGCTRPYLCKGFCRLHWERYHKHGTTSDPAPLTGSSNGAWKGDAAGYKAVHLRMSNGPRPANCGTTEGRHEWALKPGTPEDRLLRSPEGYAYSTDPADYRNLCKTCHNREDLGRDRCKAGHPLSGDNLYVQPSNGKRYCRTCQSARRLARTLREKEVI